MLATGGKLRVSVLKLKSPMSAGDRPVEEGACPGQVEGSAEAQYSPRCVGARCWIRWCSESRVVFAMCASPGHKLSATMLLLLFLLLGVCNGENRGPVFVLEPPSRLDFSNSSGGWLDCSAAGSPVPAVTWLSADGGPASDVPGVRRALGNGTLVLLPFPAAAFRQDVHATSYRCLAENVAGRVLSRAVHVRAVVSQAYQAMAEALPAARGCTAVLRCVLPSFVREFVRVVSWLQEPSFYIYPSMQGDGKHHLLPTGELLVHHVESSDRYFTYRCRTIHRLTRQVVVSSPTSISIHESRGVVPPNIVEHSATVHVGQDEGAVLVCASQGCPGPDIRWSRIGHLGSGSRQPIAIPSNPSGGRARALGPILALEAVGPEDAGLYRCAANNSGGAAGAELRLYVAAPLRVTLTPAVQTAELGSAAEFHCEASPEQAVINISWLKDGRSVAGSGGRRLVVRPVRREDRGMYQCVARSEDGGSAQAAAELRLGDAPPALLYSFIEQTLQPGPAVSLKCSASGNPTPSIQWKLDGFPLPTTSDRSMIGQYVTVHGDVISHVNISHVAVEDGGEYACVAENRAGTAVHAARLNVYGLPYVRPIPKVTAVAGETLVLKCPVAGYPIEEVRWERGGRELPDDLRQKTFNNGTLLIDDVQASADAGIYTCTARNKQGHSARRSGDVAVIVPPKLSPFQVDSGLQLGERMSLICTVLKGDPPLHIRWLKDGQPLGSSPGLSVTQMNQYNRALLIESLSPEHNGNYSCVAENMAAAVSHVQQLLVNVPPRIEKFSFEEELSEGMRTRTVCGVSRGDPPLSISWLKDGTPIPSSLDVAQSPLDPYSVLLSISRLRAEHSGEYTCVASNMAASVKLSAVLQVKVPPSWLVEPMDTSVPRNRHAMLHCQASGVPQPSTVWKKAASGKAGDYQEVRGSGGSSSGRGPQLRLLSNGSLMIQHSREEDEGFYLCQASNGIGAALRKVVQFRVDSAPHFTSHSHQLTVKKGETAVLKCHVAGDSPLSVVWMRGKEVFNPAPAARVTVRQDLNDTSLLSSLVVNDARQSDSGSYVCIANNNFGREQQLLQLTVQEPPSSPANLEPMMVGSRAVRLQWSHPDSSQVSLFLIEYFEQPGSWEHSRSTSVPGSTQSVVLEPLTPATRYVARVVAQGPAGRSLASAELRFTTQAQRPAGPPLQLSVTPVSSSALAVSWSPPRSELQHGTISSYNVGVRLASSAGLSYNFTSVAADAEETRGSLLLAGLRKFSRYWVAVQAVNQEGPGPLSEPVAAATLEDIPTRPPLDVRCAALSSQSLQVTWQPPPAAHTHGLLQGYRIVYEPAEFVHDNGPGGVQPESRQTQALTTVLNSLARHANYSVQVTAVTGAGDGPLSRPVFCRTSEDVPGPPRDIKVVASAPMALLVSWLPPTTPRGSLTGYTLHCRVVLPGSQQAPSEMQPPPRSLPPGATNFELTGLRQNAEYQFWLTAATRVGEGPASRVVAAIPGPRVPARIASFGGHVTQAWRTVVTLACLAVGQPTPDVEWQVENSAGGASSPVTLVLRGTVPSAGQLRMLPDNALRIDSAIREHSGNYSCQARNNDGADRVIYHLTVQVPPSAPVVFATGATTNSISLQWKVGDPGNAPISGYSLNFRVSHGDWEELEFSRRTTSHVLQDLRCGSEYHVFVTAHGLVGSSPASVQLTVRTQGSAPSRPPPSSSAHAQLLQPNSTSVLVRLHAWPDGGCPLSHLELQYKPSGSQHWTLVSSSLRPQRRFTVHGLAPATLYQLRVTAHNAAGSSTAEFSFSTLTKEGEVPPSELVREKSGANGEDQSVSLMWDLRVVVPLAVSCLALVGVALTACFCARSKNANEARPLQDSHTSATLDNQQNSEQREQYYACIHKMALASEKIPESAEDISPYATFHLAETTPRGSQPPPPHTASLLHSFMYHEQAGTEGCASPPTHPRSRCRNRREGSRSASSALSPSVLQDSDDGETHSDSDQELTTGSSARGDNTAGRRARHALQRESASAWPAPSKQSYMQAAQSSTSLDTSASEQKTLPRRGRTRSKWLAARKSGAGLPKLQHESSFSRDTSFDPRPSELSEAECDIDTLKKMRLRAPSSLWAQPAAHTPKHHRHQDFSIAV